MMTPQHNSTKSCNSAMLSLGGSPCVQDPDGKLVLPQFNGSWGKGERVREINYALKFAFIA